MVELGENSDGLRTTDMTIRFRCAIFAVAAFRWLLSKKTSFTRTFLVLFVAMTTKPRE